MQSAVARYSLELPVLHFPFVWFLVHKDSAYRLRDGDFLYKHMGILCIVVTAKNSTRDLIYSEICCLLCVAYKNGCSSLQGHIPKECKYCVQDAVLLLTYPLEYGGQHG